MPQALTRLGSAEVVTRLVSVYCAKAALPAESTKTAISESKTTKRVTTEIRVIMCSSCQGPRVSRLSDKSLALLPIHFVTKLSNHRPGGRLPLRSLTCEINLSNPCARPIDG